MKADDATLSQLMRAAQGGDKVAYRSVLTASEDWLRRYFARRVPPAQLDDLVQEVLISVHRKRAAYDPGRPYLPWLAAIARFRWIDTLRKIYRQPTDELYEDTASTPAEDEAVMARISVDSLMGQLSENQMVAIRLVKLEGLSIKEASDRCGQSESAVKVNIHRGINKMAALVESE